MGRSVNYLNNAEVVLYFPYESENDGYMNQLNWNDLIRNLQNEIKAKLPSYNNCDDWDNRETKIILENSFCNIGISEYCGLVSLSVAPKEFDSCYSDTVFKENFAINHAQSIKKTLEKVLANLSLTNLRKIGTFSNGEAVFQRA